MWYAYDWCDGDVDSFLQNFSGSLFKKFVETSLAAKKSPPTRGDSGSIIIISEIKLLINPLSSLQ